MWRTIREHIRQETKGNAERKTKKGKINGICPLFTLLKLIDLPITSFLGNGLGRSTGFLLVFGILVWIISLANTELFIQISLVVLVCGIFALISWRYVLDEMDKRVLTSAISKATLFRK